MAQSDDRHFILQIALKCADISNPVRPWSTCKVWSHRVCDEFFQQGKLALAGIRCHVFKINNAAF